MSIIARRVRRRRVVRKLPAPKSKIVVYKKYYKIDTSILLLKTCRTIDCVRGKWIALKSLNEAGLKRARKRGGLFKGKAGNRYKAQLRKYILKHITDATEKKLWNEYDLSIKKKIKEAENIPLQVGKGVGKVIGGVTTAATAGITTAVKSIFGGLDKKVKIIVIIIVVIVLGSAGAVGAYKLSKFIKVRQAIA